MTYLDDWIARNREELERHPPGNTGRAEALFNLADSLRNKFEETDDVTDLDGAIALHRSALALRPTDHLDRYWSLHWLAWCLYHRHRKQGTDLEEAIVFARSALDLRPEGHPDRSASLNNLAAYLCNRYSDQKTIADLEEAITLCRTALVHCPPGHPGRDLILNNLADDLRRKFLERGDSVDLEDAILLHREALYFRPKGHPNRSNSLHNLAICFSDRYKRLDSLADLDGAITLSRAALELRPPGHINRAWSLSSLGGYVWQRFLKLDANADLEEAISLHRSALDLRPAGHSDRKHLLDSLVTCLFPSSKTLETTVDLEELITLHKTILDLHPPDQYGHAVSIDKLLLHIRQRAQVFGIRATLEECIAVGQSALALHNTSNPNQPTYIHRLFSELRSGFRNDENISVVQETHPDHATVLHDLHVYIKDMIDKGDVVTDVDGIVGIAQAACRLCPPHHSSHVMLLVVTLAAFHRSRFQLQGVITDLDMAIILYREAHQLENTTNAQHMHGLAWCLSERFARLSAGTDLDDAITFEQDALTLCPRGHPDRAKSLDSLADYRQMKINWRGASPRPNWRRGPTTNTTIEKIVGNIVFEALKAFPPRLMETHTGMLCDRDSQVSHFKNSQEYTQLVSSTSALNTLPHDTHIHAVISTYFQYTTLSHRWGAFEPLLHHIQGKAIYDLDPIDGLSKLQSFCLTSFRHGYSWAWSDTCCIDKESSAELQEAIGSMFSWYQQSTITLVHLADVSDMGVLTNSEWFKRGWTLQELLASRSLLFLTQDWSLYKGISSNHKEDSTILGELEQATGIASQHLTDFYPSVDDARLRLQWASTRLTTRPEDISYSLFGVFGLHIPVLYGESTANALGRLLADVITKSGDITILDWVGQPSVFHSCFPATIVPYQTTPPQSQSLELTAPSNVFRVWKIFTPRSVRKMHQALSSLPLTQFSNFRLILPCIVHRIKTIVQTTRVHRIQARGLEPIEIALSQALEDISDKVVPYVLIRPWHSKLLDASVMLGDASAHRWLTKMKQPFSALLLKKLPHNEFKRVASTCHILAHPTDSAGVLKGEVTMLTIV